MADEIDSQQILIVDDLPENLALLARLLSNWKTLRAQDAGEVFRVLDSCQPDLILLDIMMPGVDGFDICRRLKADDRWRDIPVIFMTGSNSPEGETMGLTLGAVDYIPKPFSAAAVRARVRLHLSLALARKNLARHNEVLERQVALRTARLEDALQQLQDASMETIIRLCRAAEYRDEDTGSHLVRIAFLGAAIARQMALPRDSVDLLMRAAPLHDIGKIGIPDRVLLKPGRLDAEEFELVKTHTVLGAKILQGSRAEIIRLGEVIALTHHEQWSGDGYPRGLKGTEIPLPGRILAVADVFDALTSRRPYKEPFPIDKSLEILCKRRGTTFDPDVVDAFVAAETEVVEIANSYTNGQISPLFFRATIGQEAREPLSPAG
jgi:putative two-component system response regulator